MDFTVVGTAAASCVYVTSTVPQASESLPSPHPSFESFSKSTSSLRGSLRSQRAWGDERLISVNMIIRCSYKIGKAAGTPNGSMGPPRQGQGERDDSVLRNQTGLPENAHLIDRPKRTVVVRYGPFTMK